MKSHGIYDALQSVVFKDNFTCIFPFRREQTLEMLWEFAQAHGGEPVLFYSSDSPEQVKQIQETGKAQVAELLEQAIASLARQSVDAGYTRIIVAGGETSGAVARALGFDSFIIGESVAPGVPVMIPEIDGFCGQDADERASCFRSA